MRDWSPEQLAAAAGARVLRGGGDGGSGPVRATIDSRAAGPEDLFVGLPGEHVDGGSFAAGPLEGGAWGVLVAEQHAAAAAAHSDRGVVLAAADPLLALQDLATGWRRALGAQVIGVTGSTGKTSTKDLLRAMLAPQRRTVATPRNLNTEIGLPLTVLEAPAGTEVLVLEMAMRGAGQIAELARIAEPDVGVIVNIGPVHLELLGSIEAVAATKAELLDGLRPGGTAIVPFGEPLLDHHLPRHAQTVTFGPGGDVSALPEGLTLTVGGLEPAAHLVLDALAALAAARAVGVEPTGPLDVELSALRGERIEVGDGVVVVVDCYNANPMSMRAALDDLAARAPGRRVGVLGDMLELGPEEQRLHRELGEQARAAGVELLVTVGPLAAHAARAFGGDGGRAVHCVDDAAAAAELLPGLLQPGDTVLVKGSRGVGLEVVAQALAG